MKTVLGIVLVVGGIAFGLYAGFWWAFIGGIVDVIGQVRAPELSAMAVAIGVAKVFFAALIGVLSGLCLVAPGAALINSR